MAECDKYPELISASLDGALSPEEVRELEEHLARCPQCRALERDLKEIHDTLSSLPGAEPPDGLSDRIMAALDEDHTRNIVPLPGRKTFQWKRWAASAAALALVLLGAWGMNRGDDQAGETNLEAAFYFQDVTALPNEATGYGLYGTDSVQPEGDSFLAKSSLRIAEIPGVNDDDQDAADSKDEDSLTSGEDLSPMTTFSAPQAMEPTPAPETPEAVPEGSLAPVSALRIPMDNAIISSAPSLTIREALEQLLKEKGFTGYEDGGEDFVTWPRTEGGQEILSYSALSENGKYHVFILSRLVYSEETGEPDHSSRLEVYAVSLDGSRVMDGSEPDFWMAISN